MQAARWPAASDPLNGYSFLSKPADFIARSFRRLRQLRKRRFRRRNGVHPDIVTDSPTPNESLLYLVCKVEDTIERSMIEWSADLAATVEHRLEIIVQVVRQIVRRDRQRVA
jgi:hypothetical protein